VKHVVYLLTTIEDKTPLIRKMKRKVVMLVLQMATISSDVQYNLDVNFAKEFPDNFWLSWKVADRSSVILTFQVSSTKDVLQMREGVLNLVESATITKQIIVEIWEYVPDFRDELITQKLADYE
jgi:hypothetical protein